MFADALQLAGHRIAVSWPWYVIRGSGFIAAGLLILLMLSGIGQVTGIIYRFIEPLKVWLIHKALGIALLVSIAFHISFLLIDHFVSFSLTQILLPFTSSYNNGTKLLGLPLGGLAVTMGVLAMYCAVVVVITSLGWIDTKQRAWRLLHYLSYVLAILAFLHALYAGTDVKYGTFRVFWVLLGLVIVVGIVARLWRVGTVKPQMDESSNDLVQP